jgi:hypothetical protein
MRETRTVEAPSIAEIEESKRGTRAQLAIGSEDNHAYYTQAVDV